MNNNKPNILFISPPFGNYKSILSRLYNLDKIKKYEIKYIKGSYTLEPRLGLFSQIIKTLRYSFAANGWINKIGLRNPGIKYAIEQNYNNLDEEQRTKIITSIAILDKDDIPQFQKYIPHDMNLEINISCPNVEHSLIASGISGFINKYRTWCIVKLSPIATHSQIDELYNQGFRQFHCSNTLPIANGGLSGPSLKPYTSRLITYISRNYPDCEIIAGGGITSINNINEYKHLGAMYFSVSTLLFNPWKSYKFFNCL